MIWFQKLIVFIGVTLLNFHMIRLFYFSKSKLQIKTATFHVLIIGLSLLNVATLLDIIGILIGYLRIYMMIKILFTIGAVFYICGVIFWSKYTKVIIEKLEERSSTDFLTGTLNRYGLEAIYNDISKKGKSFFIIVCDLNGTKRVNDNKGHLFGDRYITETSKILKDIIGSKGYVARTGGDEFIILLNHMTIDELERYLLKIKQLISEIDQDQQTGMSTGYSLFPKDGTSFEELMRIADDKMYCDKKLHRQHIDISKEK